MSANLFTHIPEMELGNILASDLHIVISNLVPYISAGYILVVLNSVPPLTLRVHPLPSSRHEPASTTLYLTLATWAYVIKLKGTWHEREQDGRLVRYTSTVRRIPQQAA